MSDNEHPDQPQPAPAAQDDIPVEELIRITREFTRRITNQDRQRLAVDLRESGHQRSLQIAAPIALQQFFAGEVDLDTELARRFANAPLLSHVHFVPEPGEPVRRQASAIFACQDDSMLLTFDVHTGSDPDATLDMTFTLSSALALRFRLAPLQATDRRRWLDMMQRESGITFLWTRQRWEQPYVICVVREHFARLYAFSPAGFEASVRLTPDMSSTLLDWLGRLWFPDTYVPRTQRTPRVPARYDGVGTEWAGRGTDVTPLAPITSAPPGDMPEEQWDDAPPIAPDDLPPSDDMDEW
ncbi:MAG: hypothetical protein JW910_14320 [Anaerolineae bacterium]|nr:hypothetical protein [Anaerolineae bacterium]